jgi:Tfp pilus assembly protein PilX
MIRRLRADERGIALPVALAALLILSLLGTAAVLAATETNSLTGRDGNTKAALEAADAGLRVAAYRLNQLRPDATHCPTVPATATGTGNLCASPGVESLGNGASYRYWISGAMTSGACAGYAVDSTQSSIAQRCVTAIGTAGGVSARTQERAVAYTSTPVFPAAIYGTRSVTISNNATVSGTAAVPGLLGTNGVLTVGRNGGGTTTIDGYQVGPGATVSLGSNTVNLDPPSATLPANRTTAWPSPSNVPFGDTATVNSDARICTLDPCTGGVSFNPVTRQLNMPNNSSLTLGGGIYNFCDFIAANNAHITIGATVQTQIYIDSASRTLSDGVSPACSGATTGTFTLSNGDALDNPSANPLNVQIYVYGNPALPGSNVASLFNNSNSYVTLDAPFSTVNISPSNNTTYSGAIGGYAVTLGNAGHFVYVPTTNTLQVGSLGLYYRAYWTQCPSTPTDPTDPTSGC